MEISAHNREVCNGRFSNPDLVDFAIVGSWRGPTPGSPVATNHPDKEHQLGQKVTDLNDPIARANFRVVIIKPEVVEQTDLSDPATSRRYVYTLITEGDHATWRKEEQWP